MNEIYYGTSEKCDDAFFFFFFFFLTIFKQGSTMFLFYKRNYFTDFFFGVFHYSDIIIKESSSPDIRFIDIALD
jgi:hypothetical protein